MLAPFLSALGHILLVILAARVVEVKVLHVPAALPHVPRGVRVEVVLHVVEHLAAVVTTVLGQRNAYRMFVLVTAVKLLVVVPRAYENARRLEELGLQLVGYGIAVFEELLPRGSVPLAYDFGWRFEDYREADNRILSVACRARDRLAALQPDFARVGVRLRSLAEFAPKLLSRGVAFEDVVLRERA